MNVRAIVVAALVLPSAAFAQVRGGEIGVRRPGQPVPLGRQPVEIARSVAMQRSRYSIESYPLFSRVYASSSPGIAPAHYNTFGAGTHLDYRGTQWLSYTLDMTSTTLGGPTTAQTAELGFRLRPSEWDSRLRPFVDVRGGFEVANDGYFSSNQVGFGPNLGGGSRYSRGFGGSLGAGAEYTLTPSISVTTSLSALRTNMVAYSLSGFAPPTGGNDFHMTSYRLALGFRYNPVRYLNLASTR